MHPLSLELEANELSSRLNELNVEVGDVKWWSPTSCGKFSVKSFYSFLSGGGLQCQATHLFWKKFCPRKINLFNWLAWKTKILTLKILAKRWCNKLLSTTCIFCHSESESVNISSFNAKPWNRSWAMFGHHL